MDTRRDFLKKMIAAGILAPFAARELLASPQSSDSTATFPDFTYKYRAFSVGHLPEMQEWMDGLIRSGKLSSNEVFQSYVRDKRFKVPDDFPEARSLVVLAVFTRMMYVDFHLDGKVHELIIPPQYYDDGITVENVQNTIQTRIIQEPGYRVRRAKGFFMKTTAVRSGLAAYGRNNISYVDGMGSFHTLYAFFTNYRFKKDDWRELRMMDRCESCGICMSLCPNKAIREESFVIDAGRCLTLYNEIEGDFPAWIDPSAHNALLGCMRCQLSCPANREVVELAGRLEDVTEEETRKVLEGKPDDELIQTLGRKLKGYSFASAEGFPLFTRNLRALLAA